MTTIIWISGGSGGIGSALIETVPWDDARIVDVSRSGVGGHEHLRADLSDELGWAILARSFEQELASGGVDRAVFVHAAATITPIGYAGEVDAEGYRRQVVLNSASPQVLGDAFIRAVTSADVEGHMIVLTSGAASSVYPGWSAYSAGKAAVDQWVRTTGAERASRGDRCRVLAVAPGVVATQMQEEIRATPEDRFPRREKFVSLHEQGGLREPTEAAEGIWSLLDRDLENGAVVDLRDL